MGEPPHLQPALDVTALFSGFQRVPLCIDPQKLRAFQISFDCADLVLVKHESTLYLAVFGLHSSLQPVKRRRNIHTSFSSTFSLLNSFTGPDALSAPAIRDVFDIKTSSKSHVIEI